VDCEQLPAGPFETRRVPYIKPSADIAFDDEGYLYWSESGSLFRARAGEAPSLLAEHIDLYAGLRASPSGYLFAETESGLARISPEGTLYPMLPGVRGLLGLELDAHGRAYLTDYFGGRVLRFDPATHELTTLSTGVIPSPSGLTFSPQFDTLYVSTWGGAEVPTLYRIALGEDGKAGPTEPWVQNLGGGINDGMASDECGNVYVADNGGQGDLLRISPDGTRRELIVSRPGESLVNFQWGRGRGWSRDKLYIVSLTQGLLEADMPVRSKTYW
jgi:sugar lactone lactonase YvrE